MNRLKRNLMSLLNVKNNFLYSMSISSGNRFEKKILKKNLKFKDMHKGERCFILGNGPSLKEENLTLLKEEFVFSVNQITKHKDFKYINPTYHFWADPIFFNISKENPQNKELFDSFRNVKTEQNNPECFFPIEFKEKIEDLGLAEILNTNYFKSKLIFHDGFKKDIKFHHLIPGYYTVVQWAISMAIYMGFKEIYLLGIDTTTIITKINAVLQTGEPQYGYEISENEKERVRKVASQYSMETQLKVEAKVLEGYRILNEFANLKGINIYNCSTTTIVDSIEKKNFCDVIGTKEIYVE